MKNLMQTLLFCLILTQIHAQCQEQDYIALRALYLNTGGDNWDNNTGWLDSLQFINNPTIPIGTDVSTWYGVMTNVNGCVTCIDMDGNGNCNIFSNGGNNLIGSIPTELGNLSNLEWLSLSLNQLSGSIFLEIGDLTNLTFLSLSDNQLTGSIPSEIGNLTKLEDLWLSNNHLTNSIPSEIGNLTKLTYLWLSNNQFTGSIPPEIGNLTNLRYLWLSNNQFTDSIPPEISNLTNLSELSLSTNQLTGNIPPEIGNLTSLKSLWLSNNKLSGNIPPEIGNLTSLKSLRLYTNQLVGSIPSQLGLLINLNDLNLSYNQLDGNIISEIGSLINLKYLRVHVNKFDGSIPSEIGNLTNLTELYLYDNQLSSCYNSDLSSLCTQLSSISSTNANISDGNNLDAPWEDFCTTQAGICTVLQECQEQDYLALRALYLSTGGDNWANNINWPDSVFFVMNPNMPVNTNVDTWYGVTTDLDGCVACVDMDGNHNCLSGSFGGNNLSGGIPPELGNLNNLTCLSLSSNQLIGSIPPELGNLTNLASLDLFSNNLSGSIPAELGNLNNLTWLSFGDNQLSGEISPELGNLNNLTYLYLDRNQITGNISPELGNLGSLRWLHLSNNKLTGNIPLELGSLSNLEELELNNNRLTGSIPTELGNLSNLWILSLYNNNLVGCYYPNLISLCSHTFYNWEISDGNNFDAPWEAFCAIGVDACDIPNVVLPGNFDNNAIAEAKDLLYWGAAYGYTGPPRDSVTTEWTPQYNTEDWATSVDGVNSKHQDANGDSIVDMLDLEALELNYGETYGIDSFEYHPTDAMFVIEELEIINGAIHFDLHIVSETPVSAHGISATIDISEINNVYNVEVDTIGSSLHPDAYIYRYDEDIIDIALTRTDKVDQIIDGSVASLVVMVKDIQSLTAPVININGGYVMSATGELTTIGGSNLYGHVDAPISLAINHAYCDEMGTAKIYVPEVSLYSCVWSTGETKTSIEGLDAGSYSVAVNVGMGTTMIDFDIANECPTLLTNVPIVPPASPPFTTYLVNSLGAAPRLVYELEKHGTVDINLYNIHGQRLRTIYKARSGAGDYQIDIDKGGLPQGIYFIHIYYESNGDIGSKTLKILI